MLALVTTHLAKTIPLSPADNAVMNIEDVNYYLKVTERIIYRLAGAKKISSFKVTGSWRFPKADIDRWIREQSSGSADESGD